MKEQYLKIYSSWYSLFKIGARHKKFFFPRNFKKVIFLFLVIC